MGKATASSKAPTSNEKYLWQSTAQGGQDNKMFGIGGSAPNHLA